VINAKLIDMVINAFFNAMLNICVIRDFFIFPH